MIYEADDFTSGRGQLKLQHEFKAGGLASQRQLRAYGPRKMCPISCPKALFSGLAGWPVFGRGLKGGKALKIRGFRIQLGIAGVVGWLGLEPRTNGLKGRCSTD
jgi:hypothetical protein